MMFKSPTGNPQISASKQNEQYMEKGLASKRVKIIAAVALAVVVALVALWPVIGPDYVFSDSQGFLDLTNGGMNISKYRGTETEVVIPGEHRGADVIGINYAAFEGNKHCRSIVVPDTVTMVDDYAFCSCPELRSVQLPEGLKSIEPGVFWQCTALEEVNIPKGVTEIKHAAFMGCSNLETIDIPMSVETIAMDAFEGCGKLVIRAPRGISYYFPEQQKAEKFLSQIADWEFVLELRES